MKNKNLRIVATIVNLLLIVLLIVGHYYAGRYSQVISTYLGHETTKVITSDEEIDSEYYKSDFSSQEEAIEYGEMVTHEIGKESIVLLNNNNSVLPLSNDEINITVFGQNSVDFVYGGEGASSMDKSKAIPLEEALSSTGFNINPTLIEFYTEGGGSSYRKSKPDVYGEGEFAVNEVPVSEYTDEVVNSFEEYNDAAIVIIGRSGGESNDIATEALDSGAHYLELDQDEQNMISLAKENFEKVIVVLNTLNPMELGTLNELEVDATIWVGTGGSTGILAIGEVLNGTVNPSGRLTDTYAYDVFSSPAMNNYGDFQFTNVEIPPSSGFMTYNEGIYVGYRYYETRYEDTILARENVGNFNYEEEVLYPFGFGLSYTEFDYSNMEITENENDYVVDILVSNNGEVAGKDVVQLYLQSPFTEYDIENSIEKPALEIVGFEKTEILEPGEEVQVSISVPKETFKVYDTHGAGTYIVDEGNYYFSIGRNAHDALNNILAEKGFNIDNGMTAEGNRELTATVTINEFDDETYAVSQVTDYPIENQFSDVDMATYDDSVTYLSRANWEGTWPEAFAGGQYEAPEEIISSMEITRSDMDEDSDNPILGEVNEEYGQLTLIDLKEADYDDPRWQALVEQLTIDELTEFIRMGGYATVPIESINVPATVIRDGTAGLSGELVGGSIEATAFPVELNLATTWNTELIKEMGNGVGEDTLYNKVAGWYAPGMNIHRVPFGGRNFEYFSEDSLLSGKMAAAIIEGAQAKGAFTHSKHFVLNETDTNRVGGSMYSNEQALRELYLAPFEIAVREGNGNGFMASMNRVGPTWSGAHYGLMTNVLRNEWGFEGFVATDQASFSIFGYQDIIEGLHAGTNLWLNTDAELWQFAEEDLTPTVINNLQDSAHAVLYTIVNSNAMNGIDPDGEVVSITPTWQYWLWSATAVVVLFVIGSSWFVFRRKK